MIYIFYYIYISIVLVVYSLFSLHSYHITFLFVLFIYNYFVFDMMLYTKSTVNKHTIQYNKEKRGKNPVWVESYGMFYDMCSFNLLKGGLDSSS